jgi:hypothetical protein
MRLKRFSYLFICFVGIITCTSPKNKYAGYQPELIRDNHSGLLVITIPDLPGFSVKDRIEGIGHILTLTIDAKPYIVGTLTGYYIYPGDIFSIPLNEGSHKIYYFIRIEQSDYEIVYFAQKTLVVNVKGREIMKYTFIPKGEPFYETAWCNTLPFVWFVKTQALELVECE